MFAQLKTLTGLSAESLLIRGLVGLATLCCLTSHPLDVSEHKHTDHAGHAHISQSDAQADAASSPLQAFSLSSLLGMHSITTENFPVEPVAAMARRVAAELQPGIQRPIHIVSVSRRELTPVAAVARNRSMCVIVLNTNPDGWAVWERFFDRVAESERMNVAEVAIAHEIGHCAEREAKGQDVANAAFDPLEGEVFADIFATLYAQQFMGERARIALDTLQDLRDEYARREPTHATGERLKALQTQFQQLQGQPLTPVTMAQTASQLREAHIH